MPVSASALAWRDADHGHGDQAPSDRGAARISIFRCSDEELLGQVAVGPHPNALAFDARRRCLYTFNLGEPLGENCTVSVVDVVNVREVTRIPVGQVPKRNITARLP